MDDDEENILSSILEEKKKYQHDIAIRIIVDGNLKYVSIRSWIKSQAIKKKINGWARYKKDSLEALLIGKEENIKELIKMIYRSPASAQIKRIREFPQSDIINIRGFSLLPTIR